MPPRSIGNQVYGTNTTKPSTPIYNFIKHQYGQTIHKGSVLAVVQIPKN